MEQQIIKDAWNKYVLNKEEIPNHVKGVRDEILNSWKRCRTFLNSNLQTTKSLSNYELNNLLKKNELLIEVAYPYLLNFYEDLEAENFIIMLTDNKGCMLKSIGHTKILSKMVEENHFFEGHFFSEEEAGTGGVGLCLIEKKPVIVYGCEHYNEFYHNLVCYGAPLEDLNGEIIGSISITGFMNYHQSAIMGMVKTAKKGIEKEFSLKRMNNILKSTIHSFDSGIIVLDNNNRVLYHNEKALSLLQYKNKDIHGTNISNIIDLNNLDNLKGNLENYECTIINCYNQPLYLSISLRFNHNTSLSSKILYIESQSEKYKVASLIAGFKATHTFNSIKGITPVIDNLKKVSYNIASMDTPLLILGEKGTETDILAEAIHNESKRKKNPFVSIDCTASKQSLLNELFGKEHQLSKLELADEGTLFLYEISQLPLEVQEKLFDFLKNKEIQKDNNQYPKKINTRIIAHSTINLLSLVEKGHFHRQLYFLLNTMVLTIPPLRERKEDISILINSISRTLSQLGNKQNISFDKESMNALCSYHWPGNIKQLESIIESAIYSCNNNIIQLSDLPIDIVNDHYSKSTSNKSIIDFNKKRNDMHLEKETQEYNELLFAIKESHGNVKMAAEILFMPASTVYRKLKKYKINPKNHKSI